MKKVVAKAMKEVAEREVRELNEHTNKVFELVKPMRKNGKDVEGGSCMRGSDGALSFDEGKPGKSTWKDLVEGPAERVSWEEVVKAIREMKAGKAIGPSEVSVEMIAASGEIGTDVMMELCQGMLDGRGMRDEWALSVVVPIFKRKGGAMSCGVYGVLRKGGEVVYVLL